VTQDDILKLKLKFTSPELVKGLPAEMLIFLNILNGMLYETDPDYDALDRLFVDMLRATGTAPPRCLARSDVAGAGMDESAPFDWQLPDTLPAALADGAPAALSPLTPLGHAAAAAAAAGPMVRRVLLAHGWSDADGQGEPRRFGASLQPRPPADLPTNRPLGTAAAACARPACVLTAAVGRYGSGVLRRTGSMSASRCALAGQRPRGGETVGMLTGTGRRPDLVDGPGGHAGSYPSPLREEFDRMHGGMLVPPSPRCVCPVWPRRARGER
jgi:hypothetical protein